MSDFLNLRHNGKLDSFIDAIKEKKNFANNTDAAYYAVKNIISREQEIIELKIELIENRHELKRQNRILETFKTFLSDVLNS